MGLIEKNISKMSFQRSQVGTSFKSDKSQLIAGHTAF